MKFDVETELPRSACCECGHLMDRCSAAEKPSAGDFTLCIRCGSLNIFASDLRLRQPTDDEIFQAAADPNIQEMRRAILAIQEKAEG